MFNEKLREFQETQTRLYGIINELTERHSELERKITEAKGATERALTADVEQRSKKTVNEYTKYQRLLEVYLREHMEVEKRLAVAHNLRAERLRELLPELKLAKDKAVTEMTRDIEDGKVEGYRLKAEMLIFAKRLNDMYSQAQTVQSQFLDACHAAGTNEHNWDFLHLPQLNLTGTYEGLHSSITPTVQEMLEAYAQGRLPYFVKLYLLTGEILPENKAREKFEQLQREAEKNE